MKTTLALLSLAIASSTVAFAPPVFGQAPPQIIQQATNAALQYTNDLPNFICAETVRRYAFDKAKQTWKATDTLALDLTYAEKGESYKLTTINGKPTAKDYDSVGGFTSNGEFGTLLHWVFRAESHTRFEWKWSANLRGRNVEVFAFHIEKEHSEYHVGFNNNRYNAIFPWGGLVYIDRATHQVLRLNHGPDAFPTDWPATGMFSDLDYDFVDLGGQSFLLPLHAEMRLFMRDGYQFRSEILFRDYHRFTSQATVRATP